MIKSDVKIKGLSSILNEGNNTAIAEAISSLRNEQPFVGAIGLLTSFYDKTDDTEIRKKIEGFMNDLKDNTVRTEVMAEIKKPWKSSTTSMLVSSCWQSGLDYSEYSLDMVKVFFLGDYLTAVECLTVIEESAHELTKEKKEELMKIIDASHLSQSNEKIALAAELKAIIERK